MQTIAVHATTTGSKGTLMRFLKGALLCLTLCPALAFAGTCSGPSPFTDVLTTDSFCSNAEWLKNRGVTLGCTATTYCPSQSVTRAQMALFMNRLADAILPAPTMIEDMTTAMSLTALATDSLQCVSPSPIAAASYPRNFTMSTHLSLITTAGAATIAVQPLYSDDSGATWKFPNTLAERVGFDNLYTGHVTSEATFTVAAGKTVMVAQGVASYSGATAIAANGRCHILVRQQSVTGASSPYDSAPHGIAEGQ